MRYERESNTSSKSAGTGFTGMLTIAFIVLKLVGVIDWPWWWVISPIWISIRLVLAILLVIGIVMLIKYIRVREQKKEQS